MTAQQKVAVAKIETISKLSNDPAIKELCQAVIELVKAAPKEGIGFKAS
ncbi:hypothetical protein ACSCB1_35325 [Streptomyces europaeiscabiei]|nr:hypothetical protein [Streptomyces europaeiscabiei]